MSRFSTHGRTLAAIALTGALVATASVTCTASGRTRSARLVFPA